MTCPDHPWTCIGTDHWEGACNECGTTADEARAVYKASIEMARLGGLNPEQVARAVEFMRASGLNAWHRPEAYGPAPGPVRRSLVWKVAVGSLEVGSFLAARAVREILSAPYWIRRTAATFKRPSKSKG